MNAHRPKVDRRRDPTDVFATLVRSKDLIRTSRQLIEDSKKIRDESNERFTRSIGRQKVFLDWYATPQKLQFTPQEVLFLERWIRRGTSVVLPESDEFFDGNNQRRKLDS